MNIESMMIKGMVDYYTETHPCPDSDFVQWFIDCAVYAGILPEGTVFEEVVA